MILFLFLRNRYNLIAIKRFLTYEILQRLRDFIPLQGGAQLRGIVRAAPPNFPPFSAKYSRFIGAKPFVASELISIATLAWHFSHYDYNTPRNITLAA